MSEPIDSDNPMLAQVKIEDGPVFTLTVKNRGDEMDVSITFHQKFSGRQMLGVLREVSQSMIKTSVSIGERLGLTEDEAINFLFTPNTSES